ncbi:MAG: rod shape-determining protein MreC [Clostridia bacterium]|nr:rod shape-determining protein MreC [Clostridia bacterium]
MSEKHEPRSPLESNDWLQTGDDIFNETLESITAELPVSKQPEAEESESPAEEAHIETPDEILARFRSAEKVKKEPKAEKKGFFSSLRKKHRKKNTDEDDSEPPEISATHPNLRRFFLVLVTALLILLFVVIILFRLNVVENDTLSNTISSVSEGISDTVSPVQSVFSSVSDSVYSFFKRIQFWYNLENAYNDLREENERLVYQAMLADELQTQLSQFENMYDEVNANKNLNPLVCTVIGKNGDSYFSTLTINRGRNDGIDEYMAVTLSGALIGYTETVTENQSTIRTIIDSEASIAALIQSSRDQGTIRGTLGIDGTAMCRMYYLPDDHLPRPGDIVVTSGVSMPFPKGIPIGTVRESTRGMDANKQYIIVEPTADFQHIEYVIVLRYKPSAGAIQSSVSNTAIDRVPLETARPYPTIRIGSLNYFATDAPESSEAAAETPVPSVSPSPTPAPTSTPVPITTPAPDDDEFEYSIVRTEDPNTTPTPTPSPTPTPYITLGPDDMTLEEE